jgi:hypothetical protein
MAAFTSDAPPLPPVRLIGLLARGLAEAEGDRRYHLRLSPSRQAMASSSTRTASSTAITGRAWNSKAGYVEQNL